MVRIPFLVDTAAIVNAAKKQILLVDDHPVFRSALRRLLEQCGDLALVGETEDPEEAMRMAAELKPDMAIVDVMLSGTDGIDLARNMVSKYGTAVLIMSIHDETSLALRAVNAGAKGYVMKAQPFNVVLKAIREVLAGRTYLGDRVKSKLMRLTRRDEEDSWIPGISSQ
jgi:DNA-binding NarL/FixJ family response regulator